MATEQYSIGYEEGFQNGWNAAVDAKPEQPAQQEQEPLAERFEAMHGKGDIWITTIAAAAIARSTSPQTQPAQPQQEPATVVQSVPMGHGHRDMYYAICDHLPVGTNLYTSPQPAQRKPWVGLTEVEADKIYKDGSTFGEMMRMVEAKLKEKNT